MQKKLIPFQVLEVYEQVEETVPEGVQLIHAPDVWENAGYGKGIVIAVIDTGVDKTHPDLKDRIIGGKDFTNTGDYQDDNGHGTHVCGTILASKNAYGVVGVAPGAKVLALKALNKDGQGESQWINAALDYAINWKGPNGEKVSAISMSLGGPADEREHALIQKAVQNNILVVCAAGNSGDGRDDTDEMDYPGAYPEVVEVGAVDLQKNLADFSNTNAEIDLVAPGVGILSTYPGGKYARLSGTSMATPHVSGAAALVKQMEEKAFGRALTEAELYAQLCIHTENLGLNKKAQGNGMINLSRPEQNARGNEIKITVESESLGLKPQTVTVTY
ncbi:serine protease [Weizmannia acidilactici]|uniref:Serine protease n=2 Tax=Weizmannia acidilactici TaxID=2607726 RepID=A0A5J4J5X9_9BACI|nr:S8 family peptidase [Weizmannia acidilactici]GER67105.1 serine protease [Weizmannia acidilactici]GER70346.1 serine protease [Weizmannia acidilactici]GER73591.1 serine protease [Weizmannia acidilactici]